MDGSNDGRPIYPGDIPGGFAEMTDGRRSVRDMLNRFGIGAGDPRYTAFATRASNRRVLLDRARAGLRRVIRPTFTGEDTDGVVWVSPKIDGFGHEDWLIAPHEARHDPPVRAALDALAALLTDICPRPPLP